MNGNLMNMNANAKKDGLQCRTFQREYIFHIHMEQVQGNTKLKHITQYQFRTILNVLQKRK